MSISTGSALRWSSRVLGILFALFVGLFALDSVGEGALPFLIHALPAIVLLVFVAVGWRWPWVGGAAFAGLALLYTLNTLHRLDWILTMAGPMLVIGVLFFASEMVERRRRGGAEPLIN